MSFPFDASGMFPDAVWIGNKLATRSSGTSAFDEGQYEFLIHDRDSVFAKHLDEPIGRLGFGY
jgi:hypothetical protein